MNSYHVALAHRLKSADWFEWLPGMEVGAINPLGIRLPGFDSHWVFSRLGHDWDQNGMCIKQIGEGAIPILTDDATGGSLLFLASKLHGEVSAKKVQSNITNPLWCVGIPDPITRINTSTHSDHLGVALAELLLRPDLNKDTPDFAP